MPSQSYVKTIFYTDKLKTDNITFFIKLNPCMLYQVHLPSNKSNYYLFSSTHLEEHCCHVQWQHIFQCVFMSYCSNISSSHGLSYKANDFVMENKGCGCVQQMSFLHCVWRKCDLSCTTKRFLCGIKYFTLLLCMNWDCGDNAFILIN